MTFSGLVGMFVRQVTDKLRDIAEAIARGVTMVRKQTRRRTSKAATKPAVARTKLLGDQLAALKPDEPMAVRRKGLLQKLKTMVPQSPRQSTNAPRRS